MAPGVGTYGADSCSKGCSLMERHFACCGTCSIFHKDALMRSPAAPWPWTQETNQRCLVLFPWRLATGTLSYCRDHWEVSSLLLSPQHQGKEHRVFMPCIGHGEERRWMQMGRAQLMPRESCLCPCLGDAQTALGCNFEQEESPSSLKI